MHKNRKQTDTYRFNGYPHLNARSIHPVQIADLELRINQFQTKLADPNDPDDKKWTARWLRRFQKEIDKKREGIQLKQASREAATPRNRSN